ncbi:hypothetical protein DES40_1720 [Litorimonas taeanensis]|uniref:Uncharacterized protein n=1 Tax=Litorimonas taeanensis TaxID=568099 RepID=A0A420WD37_9PROT|nr:hypothetical protein [Litorimonas taeanensis]RKQ68944.1 hypothetical protein DES40_1720 [Litorimonas taeanensis]
MTDENKTDNKAAEKKADETLIKTVTSKPKTVQEGLRPLEKDGAPAGYTYRLLLKDSPVYGARGTIATLTLAEAKALKTGEARIPTDKEKGIGLR